MPDARDAAGAAQQRPAGAQVEDTLLLADTRQAHTCCVDSRYSKVCCVSMLHLLAGIAVLRVVRQPAGQLNTQDLEA